MEARLSTLILVLSLIATLGCTAQRAEPTRFPVSGTVTLDGKPLAKGLIYFKTVSEGSLDALDIVDGKFQGEAEAGERRVEITALRPSPGGTPGMDAGEENFIPAKFNTNSTLTANVSKEQANEFDFAVTSK